ncbi:uncharacterized protein LOC143276863 [Babylonia areolata]|uniref:uncharacterized protein LOC143276863 n=1 Tax=Babylonia areolata TaxID=304850 RepID=UPI003FD1045C
MADKAGDKMTSKQKEVLRVQRSLLSRNIVWSSALAARLKERHLVTDSMIAQIDATQGRQNQIMVLLDLLPIRTTQVYDKFADALHLSGHALLADFLRDEDVSQHPLNVDDLFERLPFLTHTLKDTERNAVEAYMLEKIQECVLTHTWHWNTKDKDKALVSKMEQVEQAYRYQQDVKSKQKQVLEAERVAQMAREETMAVKAELRAVTDNSSRIQQLMKGQMDTQVKFSVANDNMAQRLSQRLKTAEQTLISIRDTLNAALKLTPRENERDLMKLAENAYHFLPEDVKLFTTEYQKLQVLQTKYQKLTEECFAILGKMGYPRPSSADDVTVLKSFQDFAQEKEGEIGRLEKEVARQEQMVEEVGRARKEEERRLTTAGTVWQNAMMSVMRKQLQDVKTSLRKKDTTIVIKEEELSKLRVKVTNLESSLATKTKEASQAQRALKIIELQSATDALPAGVVTTSSEAPLSTRPAHTFPSIKAQRTTSSPRRGGAARSYHQHHIALPGGVVVEADTQLDMYPAGLSSVPLQVTREENSRGDPRSRNQMRSTLGDLRSMHSKYPASRGGGGGGGLDSQPANHSRHLVSRGAELANNGIPST